MEAAVKFKTERDTAAVAERAAAAAAKSPGEEGRDAAAEDENADAGEGGAEAGPGGVVVVAKVAKRKVGRPAGAGGGGPQAIAKKSKKAEAAAGTRRIDSFFGKQVANAAIATRAH